MPAAPASRGDWVGFHAVDLAPAVNRGFADEEPDDGQGGWTDEGPNDMRNLPTGEWRLNGVPFRILGPGDHQGKSCLCGKWMGSMLLLFVAENDRDMELLREHKKEQLKINPAA